MAETKRSQRPRNVDYSLEVVDDLPEDSFARRSPLEDQLDKIVADKSLHGRFVRIGNYANGSAASAAANVLRKKHGDSAIVEGWTVRTKRANVVEKDHEGNDITVPRTGLFVKHEPDAVVDGAKAEHAAKVKARRAELDKKKVDRAKATNGKDTVK